MIAQKWDQSLLMYDYGHEKLGQFSLRKSTFTKSPNTIKTKAKVSRKNQRQMSFSLSYRCQIDQQKTKVILLCIFREKIEILEYNDALK